MTCINLDACDNLTTLGLIDIRANMDRIKYMRSSAYSRSLGGYVDYENLLKEEYIKLATLHEGITTALKAHWDTVRSDKSVERTNPTHKRTD